MSDKTDEKGKAFPAITETPVQAAEEIPATIPEPVSRKVKLTYDFPNLLLGIENGDFRTAKVREGGSRQVEFTITNEWVEKPVEEEVFRILGRNRINFGGGIIEVLNDELPGIGLPASGPSASEYLKLVGTEVLTAFQCVRDPSTSARLKRDVYHVIRSKITLL